MRNFDCRLARLTATNILKITWRGGGAGAALNAPDGEWRSAEIPVKRELT